MSKIIVEVEKTSLFQKFDFDLWLSEVVEALSLSQGISKQKFKIEKQGKAQTAIITFVVAIEGRSEHRRLTVSYHENDSEFENISNHKQFLVLHMGSHGSASLVLLKLAEQLKKAEMIFENDIYFKPDDKVNNYWKLYTIE